ncbi:MAG: 2,3,4,5-tetrahydropyridine-2,6-dicarboxylate N-succinyltransferase [Deltaproteobacteria bacterium]|nr:2,3,4,5-tetrahydropyridine-2,6-dicarboxylate N-succinyltransferase [Deltaproteobacteria bacterium]
MPRPTKELFRIFEELAAKSPEKYEPEDRAIFSEFREAIDLGIVRCAERREDGSWHVNTWFKQVLLAGFKLGQICESEGYTRTSFFDKQTLPTKVVYLASRVRVVPGGTSLRDGSFIAPGVVIMPPSFVNIGAYVGEDTMVDSHVLVGSCAQIGARVHLSAGVQIGGVLEPVGALPVIIEDDAMIGGSSGVYEGTIVRRRAVIGSGVVINGSTKIYDLVHEKVYTRQGTQPLEIPEGAVVVPGSRRVEGGFAQGHGLSISAPLIVKYRDERTDARTALEDALR